jgi:hypothetical protein
VALVTQFPGLVSAYADRMHRAVSGHHVLSPLGAWLLLALAGSGARNADRAALEAVLGVDVEVAARYARALLEQPHPAVSAALACWHRADVTTPALETWLGSLPATTERGALPDQAAADAWAERVSQGLIPTFPIQLSPDLVMLLASALATRISWSQPFALEDAGALRYCWGEDVHQVLRSAPTHRVHLVDTEAAGRVAVHVAGSADGLDVTSVIADEDVSPAAVIAAAHEVACGRRPALSLFDVPLGGGHAWVLTEQDALVVAADGRQESSEAVLPAWHAETDLDLLATPDLGFGDAAAALIGLLRPGGGYTAEATQRRLRGRRDHRDRGQMQPPAPSAGQDPHAAGPLQQAVRRRRHHRAPSRSSAPAARPLGRAARLQRLDRSRRRRDLKAPVEGAFGHAFDLLGQVASR